MAKDIYTVSLRDIAPSSIAPDPQIQAMIEAIDPELRGVSFDTREALIYSRIDDLPENVVDLLAWQFHVDFYEPMGMSLGVKRGLVKTAILVHKRKGTKWAVRELCDIVFGKTTVEPWHEYGGEPYHFRVTVDGSFPDAEAWEKFYRALVVTKSERDWLEAVNIVKSDELRLYYGHGAVIGGRMTADIADSEGKAGEQRLCAGQGAVVGGRMTTDIPASEDKAGEQRLYFGHGAVLGGRVTADVKAPGDAALAAHRNAGAGTRLAGVIEIHPEGGGLIG